jgi:alpha-glucosidase
MNEPSNFHFPEYFQAGSSTPHDYDPLRKVAVDDLSQMTISMGALHYGGVKHIEVHAYYADLLNAAVHEFLAERNEHKETFRPSLPFILTRSMTYGTASYSAHWTGDNSATWDFLYLSVSQNFIFNIFGEQMVGADICGFNGETNEELCARWYQAGSLYPFSRNHNELQFKDKEPFAQG